MAILPVSSVKFDNRHSIGFGNYENDAEELQIEKPIRHNASKMATVPVVVLMAMNPATINAATALSEQEMEPEAVEISAEPETSEGYGENTYVMAPEYFEEVQQQDYPYGWRYLKGEQIHMAQTSVVNGKKHTILFTETKSRNPKNEVDAIYIVPAGSSNNDYRISPPEVSDVIYHNIGKDKEFCGVKVVQPFINAKTGDRNYEEKEIRISDDAANKIMEFLLNETKYKNNTFIYIREVNTPNLLPTRTY